MSFDVRRAHAVLGLEPGVSPLKARARYRELVKRWHPDRFATDPVSHREATQKTQEIIRAYEVLKDAARYHETPLRPPRPRPRPSPQTEERAAPFVPLDQDTAVEPTMRFVLGVLFGLTLSCRLAMHRYESPVLLIAVPLVCGVLAAFGDRLLERVAWALWWLA